MQENKALVALGAAGLVGSAVGFLVAGGRAERAGRDSCRFPAN